MLVWSLGWEDPLEEGMAIHSSTLAWRIPWTEEPGRLLSHGVTKSRTQLKRLSTRACLYIWEKLWVYIVFMWPIYQSSVCTPSIAFPFFKFFWKNWVLRLEFFTCKFLFEQKWQWSSNIFSANKSSYLISPSLYIAVFLCFLLFCFPLFVCVYVCVCVCVCD